MRLQGTLTAAKGELHGNLSPNKGNLQGMLSARSIGADIYDGAYTVHSEAHEVQILLSKKFHILKRLICLMELRHT